MLSALLECVGRLGGETRWRSNGDAITVSQQEQSESHALWGHVPSRSWWVVWWSLRDNKDGELCRTYNKIGRLCASVAARGPRGRLRG